MLLKAYCLGCLALFVLLTFACSTHPSLSAASIASEPAATSQAIRINSPTPDQLALLESLNRQGAAPELANQIWLNSPPLKLADLRGKVVVIDFRTWQAYRNQYWPTMYFVDKTGQLRYVHIGEGDYQRSEQIIRALLAENVAS